MNDSFSIDYTAATWDIGFLVGMGVLGFLVLCGIALLIIGLVIEEAIPTLTGAAFALVLALLMVGVSFPFEKHYHAWYPVTGTVQQVDKRLLPKDDGMQEKIVVLFNGSQEQFGCEDTRCASVRPGDELALKCKTDWDYQAADGKDCKFVSFEPTGER